MSMHPGNKHFALLVFLILISSFVGMAQIGEKNTIRNKIDKDRENFEAVFRQAFPEEDTGSSMQHLYDILPEKLPLWIFQGQRAEISLGISDPGLDSAMAIKQATIRAIAMHALLQKTHYKNISDDYSALKETSRKGTYQTKYQDLSKITTTIPYAKELPKPEKIFFTKYGEALVLLKTLEEQSLQDTMKVQAEYMQVLIERNTLPERIEFVNFKILSTDSAFYSSNYSYKKFNRSYEINSSINEKEISIPARSFHYIKADSLAEDSIGTNMLCFDLNKGLWNAYIHGSLSTINLCAKQMPQFIKNTYDNYSAKDEQLVRSVTSVVFKTDIEGIKIKDNEIHLLIDCQGY